MVLGSVYVRKKSTLSRQIISTSPILLLCIAVYSNSPIRATVNVFVFFAGMAAGYYLYSKWIAGFSAAM